MPIAINGSGSVTGISAGGLPDGSVAQADLASGVASTGPAFYAYTNATTSVNNNSFTKINLDTEIFDTNNNFATGRFTPTVAGYYQFNASITVPSAISAIMQLSIYKNGAEALRIGQSQSTWWTLCGSGMLYMNGTTDYVELYFYQLSGGAVSIGNLGSQMNYLSGFLARSA